MALPSTIPVEVIDDGDDDDEFDWDAAVREIDVACEGAAAPSTSCPEGIRDNAQASITISKQKKHRGTRQSTLDRFIGAINQGSLNENGRTTVEVHANNVGSEVMACFVDIDLEAAKTWIYPVNFPLRDYQLSITKTALFSNTLVALPTGLGKTLIAAVVMYNFFRWFPKGTCLVKHLVCLVIDEARRASGNYAYCGAVRESMAIPVQLRILALTATPGSKQQTIQNVINNLHISMLEYRNESDSDVSPYVHNRKLELIEVAMSKDALGVNDLLLEAVQPFLA